MKLTTKFKCIAIYELAAGDYEIVPFRHSDYNTPYSLFRSMITNCRMDDYCSTSYYDYRGIPVEFYEIEILDRVTLGTLEQFPLWVQTCVLRLYGFDTNLQGESLDDNMFYLDTTRGFDEYRPSEYDFDGGY